MSENSPGELGSPQFSSSIIFVFLLGLLGNLIAAMILALATTQQRVAAAAIVIMFLLLLNATFYLVYTNLRFRQRQLSLENTSREYGEQIARLISENDERSSSEKDRLARIGILTVAESLKDSEWEPLSVMRRASRDLEFMGCFGHKWVSDDPHKKEFRRMLERIRLNGGSAKFLLVNPSSTDALQIANVRRKELAKEYGDFPSIKEFKNLAKEFPSFKLRLSDDFLHLRVLTVNHQCVVSAYLVSGDPGDELEAPQVVISTTSLPECWTLYTPLRELFEYHWNRATPVK
jgi:hypothetical protein